MTLIEDDPYNEWSQAELPVDCNPYLGMTIDELIEQKQEVTDALIGINPEKHQKRFEAVLNKLTQINAAFHLREN